MHPSKSGVRIGEEIRAHAVSKEILRMLWTIFVILLILWILGFSFHIMGSFIHILLVLAVIVLIINLISGRRAV
jgi:hypothetical protein